MRELYDGQKTYTFVVDYKSMEYKDILAAYSGSGKKYKGKFVKSMALSINDDGCPEAEVILIDPLVEIPAEFL